MGIPLSVGSYKFLLGLLKFHDLNSGSSDRISGFGEPDFRLPRDGLDDEVG